MCKLKVLLVLLICTNVLTQEKSKNEAEPKIDTFLQPPASGGYSFISQWASRLNPFNWFSSDLDTASQHHAPQHQANQPHKPPCNPCNQEPWIPMAGSHGQNTLIGFVNPSSPPEVNYGPSQHSSGGDQIGYPTNTKPNIEIPNDNIYRTLEQDFMLPPPPGPVNQRPQHPKFTNYRPPHPKPPPSFYQNKQYHHQKFAPPATNYGVPVKPIQSNFLDSHPSNTQIFPQQYPSRHPIPNHGGFNNGPPQFPHNFPPIPFPQLSRTPVVPLHNYQPFRSPEPDNTNIKDNYPDQSNHNAQVSDNVQVIPSVQVASFLSSIEHPINVIQSPIVEVTATGGDEEQAIPSNQVEYQTNAPSFQENPIIVEDTHVAASIQNSTYEKRNNDKDTGNYFGFNEQNIQNVINEELEKIRQNQTQPPLDYADWTPYQTLTTSMVPPPVKTYEWFSSTLGEYQTTTKKPKPVQIIVPYTSQQSYDGSRESKKQNFQKGKNVLQMALPPKQESVWSNFIDHSEQESKQVTQTAVVNKPFTTVVNINDFILKGDQWHDKPLLFDEASLQKNIDGWTETEYAKNSVHVQKDSTSSKLVPSKIIPSEYLTTLPYNQDVTTQRISEFKEVDSNLILDEPPATTTTTEAPTTTYKPVINVTPSSALLNSVWEMLQVSISPQTKEKVYLVTPQPKFTPEELNRKLIQLAQYRHLPKLPPKFSVLIDNKTKEAIKTKDGLQRVYSEWPHLINNLLTTTTTEKSKSEKPPPFQLKDLSSYTPPPNSTVQTYGGHSKVITVVTPTSASKKKRRVPNHQL